MSENPPGATQAAQPVRPKDDRDPHHLVGRTIGGGRYDVEHVIGLGGMGVVYQGRQAAVDRIVAIKVLMPEMVEDASLIKRFHLEARAASQLNHPNTITIHDFGREGDLLYIVMEFLQGESLQHVLKREGNLGVERTCRIVSQACGSLAEAHKKNIVHRDIKPDNIFLKEVGSEKDFAKVLDFGVAKLRDPSLIDATITQAGMIFGTPKYMSPEQAKAKKLDGRSDLYALGTVAYECLMGRVPFIAEDPVSILIQHVHDPPPTFKERRPDLDIPEEIERFVMRAMEKNRQDRFASADVMREAFDGFLERIRLESLTSGPYPLTTPPGAAYAGGYPTPSGPMAQTPGDPLVHYGAPSPIVGQAVPPTGPMYPQAVATPSGPQGSVPSPPMGTPQASEVAPVMAGPAGAAGAHSSKTRIHELPGRKRRRAKDFRDFGPALEADWQAGGSLGLGGHTGTRLMRAHGGNRGLLLAVLVLGLLLLGGVGFLIYKLTDKRPARETTAESVSETPSGAAGTPFGIPGGPGGPDGVESDEAGTEGDGASAGALAGETPAAGLTAQGDALRVRISTRPHGANLDFGDRRFERDGDVYLFDPSDGPTLEFRATADGFRSRDVSEELSEPGEDGLYELSVRLRRLRDPCVDPRTGLRDPYCR